MSDVYKREFTKDLEDGSQMTVSVAIEATVPLDQLPEDELASIRRILPLTAMTALDAVAPDSEG
jgi:hypothetical protein